MCFCSWLLLVSRVFMRVDLNSTFTVHALRCLLCFCCPTPGISPGSAAMKGGWRQPHKSSQTPVILSLEYGQISRSSLTELLISRFHFTSFWNFCIIDSWVPKQRCPAQSPKNPVGTAQNKIINLLKTLRRFLFSFGFEPQRHALR